MFGFFQKKCKKKTENDDAIIDTIVSQMDQSMSKKIFYGGSEEARSILKPVRSILYSGTSSSAEQYSSAAFFYTQAWIRTHGGLSPEFSRIAYIRDAMKKRFSQFPTDVVDRAIDKCLDYIFKNEPEIKDRVLKTALSDSDSEQKKTSEASQLQRLEKIKEDKGFYEKLINDIFPGLSMYVRDVNLSDECASKYSPGMIIKERGFTDASRRVMGMITTHRYSILSNHMADLSAFEHGTNWGLCVGQSGSHFKVLDIYEFRGKTQILLLHLPDDERWKMFENVSFSIEEQIIHSSRQRFENKAFSDPIPELTSNAWLDRCKEPLGMFANGSLFEL